MALLLWADRLKDPRTATEIPDEIDSGPRKHHVATEIVRRHRFFYTRAQTHLFRNGEP